MVPDLNSEKMSFFQISDQVDKQKKQKHTELINVVVLIGIYTSTKVGTLNKLVNMYVPSGHGVISGMLHYWTMPLGLIPTVDTKNSLHTATLSSQDDGKPVSTISG